MLITMTNDGDVGDGLRRPRLQGGLGLQVA